VPTDIKYVPSDNIFMHSVIYLGVKRWTNKDMGDDDEIGMLLLVVTKPVIVNSLFPNRAIH
jgi:hypothetical protein